MRKIYFLFALLLIGCDPGTFTFIEPGQYWALEYVELDELQNPFDNIPDTIYMIRDTIYVIDVKDGWVQHVSTASRNRKDSANFINTSTTLWFKYSKKLCKKK
jgi:hypothetical protein